MELLARLQEEMKVALKAGQKDRLGVIRMLLNEVKNIDLAPKPTTAEEAVAAYGKKLRKSRDEYLKLGKQPEADKLQWEISVVDEYLPKRASTKETGRLVAAFVANHAYTEKQLGQAMGAFMKEHGGKVDPAAANAALRAALAGK